MAKVKRSAKGVRRSAAARGRSQKARAAKSKSIGIIDRVLAMLPFTDEQLHKFFLFVILATAVAAAWFIASLAGLPAMAQSRMAYAAADAGFEVRRVKVNGVERMNELKVYERALSERDRPMALVDLEALRAKMLELSWVKDARVSRQLPDTLIINIVERDEHAVLRKPNRLMLIDAAGNELEPISQVNAQGKLLIEGSGAAKQVEALDHLLDAAPALKPQITQAEWVGNRRWNLTFKTGQKLALPEGKQTSASALVAFARMDGHYRLLGGKAVAIDLRVPEQAYFRCEDGPCKITELGRQTSATQASVN
ncbi:cell division protein FtsQ/DivIB [Erythrobacter sp. W53]|uniref:cell division protein FtsQ/DivIB n=1 Tax=Erythrobacter sp. W53 TaxID=3425947 RepID=UPI003D766733